LTKPTLERGAQNAPAWAFCAPLTGAPLKQVAVTIRTGDRPFGPVRSSRQGELKMESAGQGTIRLHLPLESTDMIYASWQK